ncbi:MAG: hypothetical protein IKW77_01100 [Salinivirgaceae bacterium]|nr:hypothetical protein [Salinivirgaceae bacterium]
MKDKMLYISQVGWNFLKQRPQFIAEGLEKYFDVYVYHFCSMQYLKNRVPNTDKLVAIYDIPKRNKFRIIKWIDRTIKKIKLSAAVKRIKPQYIWITHPISIKFIPEDYKGKIIYDCMDNHIEFRQNNKERNEVLEAEKLLITKSDIVFVTSAKLQEELLKRYKCDAQKLVLNRNAYNGKLLTLTDKNVQNKKTFTISYFGHIGSWFDFDSILESLEQIPQLEYLLVGSVEASIKIPECDRIKVVGFVPHAKLYEVVEDSDCFIMPFKISRLIESVDPIKIYEYINFNKNIISSYYPEMDRYKDFCLFYKSGQQLVQQIRLLMQDNKLRYDETKRTRFLSDNTWEKRCQLIYETICANN